MIRPESLKKNEAGYGQAAPRIFVETSLSSQRPALHMRPDIEHYVTRVLRLKDGAYLRLFNGQDGEWLAELKTKIGKEGKLCLIRQILEQPTRQYELALAIPPLRKHRMEWLGEKATELGLTALYPLKTRHTAHHLPPRERLLRRMIEAAEQSERMTVPDVKPSFTLDELLTEIGASEGQKCGQILACTERSHENGAKILELLREGLAPGATQQQVCIIVGPEGGFHSDEVAMLRAASSVKLVSLGQQVLRAETAALLALGLVQAHWF